MTATQLHRAVARSAVGDGPPILKQHKGFNWSNWRRNQKKNPIQFTSRKQKQNEKTLALDLSPHMAALDLRR